MEWAESIGQLEQFCLGINGACNFQEMLSIVVPVRSKSSSFVASYRRLFRIREEILFSRRTVSTKDEDTVNTQFTAKINKEERTLLWLYRVFVNIIFNDAS